VSRNKLSIADWRLSTGSADWRVRIWEVPIAD
jgi:hypothetical protein